jgi:hypothetical protein
MPPNASKIRHNLEGFQGTGGKLEFRHFLHLTIVSFESRRINVEGEIIWRAGDNN